ncbi:unnamed protein product [Lactuca saligna]|uniref:DUF8040 domain-containing protein n=1 Tax=Lactuca saligna TaxID=75948 RepID=A0AA36E907_LACSI|nr:unnamed protein product [Lactuca saligna]
MDSDDSNSSNDNEECVMEEDREFEMLCGLALKGIILARNLRTPCHTSDRTGHMFITEVLNGHPRRCYELFRLNVPVFRQLCLDLTTNYGLQQTRKVSIEESVGIFLMTLAHGCSNRFVQEFFNHSGETIHRHFHTVLEAVLKLSADIIKPDANYNDDVPEYILNNPRFDEAFNRAQQESYNPVRGDTGSDVYEEGPKSQQLTTSETTDTSTTLYLVIPESCLVAERAEGLKISFREEVDDELEGKNKDAKVLMYVDVILHLIDNEDLQPYSELKAREYLDKPDIHETMVKVLSAYLLREYSHLLARRPSCSPKEILSLIHEKLPTELYESCIDAEIQQRAVAYFALSRKGEALMDILAEMPKFRERQSSLIKKVEDTDVNTTTGVYYFSGDRSAPF